MKTALFVSAVILAALPLVAETNLPPAKAAAAKPDAVAKTGDAPAITLTASSNSVPTKLEGPIIFDSLLSTNKSVLMTNAEYRKPFGHKLIFVCTNSFHTEMFDIDALHPSVLARLKIDPEKAKEEQAKLDEARQQQLAAFNKQREDALLRQAAAAEKAKADAAAAAQAKADKAADVGTGKTNRVARRRPK